MDTIYVIMPYGVFNVLAWSRVFWLTEKEANEYLDNIAQGDLDYRNKWQIRPLKLSKE
jgi:hypothetical protein